MINKKVLLLARVLSPSPESIYNMDSEREIVFADEMNYAVILASRYEGKGYTTHSNLDTTYKKIRQRNMEDKDYVIIDKNGQKYVREYKEDGKFTLVKSKNNDYVDHSVLEDKEFILTWNRPVFRKKIDMSVVAKDIESALCKFRKKYRGVENLKQTKSDSETQGERWIIYSCGSASTESIYLRDAEVEEQHHCAS